MTIVILHYHLRRGGVTRVMEDQSAALEAAGVRHVILSGTPYRGARELPVVVVPELDYLSNPDPATPPLISLLRPAAREALGTDPGLWHVHNPTLGKNPLFPALLEDLLAAGQRLLLQFHDFAEDGRPDNYRLLAGLPHLYPLAPQVQYAFINSRDRELLIQAGIPAPRCHLLPNSINPPPEAPAPPPSDQRLVLYPVRGIRRKNIGELCLLAALAPADTQFALTLAPENPKWLRIYDHWQRFAEELHLPILFDVGDRLPPAPGAEPRYESWLRHATHLMTCSIAEGFGLVFLEPAALNMPLLGRNLPEITRDFVKQGISLGTLYEDLLVPLDWIDQDQLRLQLEDDLRKNYEAYGREVDDEILDRAWDSLLLGDYADFGNLPESIQRSIIQRALLSPEEVMVGIGGECELLQDWLEESLLEAASPASLDDLRHYALESYGPVLLACYRTVIEAPPAPPAWLPPGEVLDQFLEPERFHFLRT